MNNWKKFWQGYRIVDIKDEQDLLYQVGRTVRGDVIDKHLFETIIAEIIKKLDLKKDDDLLDLCCGNGVITYELSKVVGSVIGVDFSSPFIRNARRHRQLPNIQYIEGDVENLKEIVMMTNGKSFNKVLCYEALAYLNAFQLERLLSGLKTLASPNAEILLGSILDPTKKWRFFDTFSRRLTYLIKFRLLGKDVGVGRWWNRKEIVSISKKHNMECIFLEQDPSLHTAHYRYDVKLTKRSVSR